MSDIDVRYRRNKKMQMKRIKTRHDQGELRGAFATKAIDPRKNEYKRNKLSVKDVDIDTEFYDDE